VRNQSPGGTQVSTASPTRRVSVSGVYNDSPTATSVMEGRIAAFMSWRKAHAGGHTMGGSMKSRSFSNREKKSMLIRRGSLRNMKQEVCQCPCHVTRLFAPCSRASPWFITAASARPRRELKRGEVTIVFAGHGSNRVAGNRRRDAEPARWHALFSGDEA
jgi:hypothetical protein